MSYQVLARKWRPRSFHDMVGQEHVLKALIHALEKQRLHHAYLFTGTRGVGKTTIGRIMARCLNCEGGITAKPCGTCGSCREILEGRFVDLIEIDAASRTKVEDMRELLDNVQYSPTRGRFKVYLIDEVHMLSNSSFNALLKTLEEPPEHVKFLFATTDPQKLPVTILSRCLQFNLKRMTQERIVGHLRYVLGEEAIPFEEEALWALARGADGSMRDALSLTDQAIAFGDQRLVISDVSSMLGTINPRDIHQLAAILAQGHGPSLLAEIARISEFAPDYRAILEDVLGLFHRVALEQVVPGSADNSVGDAEQVRDLARQLPAEDVQLFYQTALMGRRDLDISPDARMGFEMTLLRMLAFRPAPHRAEPPARVSAAASAPVAEVIEEPEPAGQAPVEVVEPASPPPPQPPAAIHVPAPELSAAVPMIVPSPEVIPVSSAGSAQGDEIPLSAYDDMGMSYEDELLPVDLGIVDNIESAAPVETVPSVPAVAMVADDIVISRDAEPLDAEAFDWCRDFSRLGIGGMAGSLVMHAALQLDADNRITLLMDEGQLRLLNDRHRERVREVLSGALSQSLHIDYLAGNPGRNTPAAWAEAGRIARQRRAEEVIQADPLVKDLCSRFDGQIVDGSIESRDGQVSAD